MPHPLEENIRIANDIHIERHVELMRKLLAKEITPQESQKECEIIDKEWRKSTFEALDKKE